MWASTKIPQFWGKRIKSKKYVSYAESMWGMCDSRNIPSIINKLTEKVRLLSEFIQLKKFKGLSVRDERTKTAISKIVGSKRVTQVLDPTFLLKDVVDLEKIYRNRIITDEYVLVYSYSLVGEDINPIIEYARENHLKICVIGYMAVWADII